jgi:hypothetical protein
LTCILELTIASLAEYLLTEAKLLVVKQYIVTPYDKSFHCTRRQRGLRLARDRRPLLTSTLRVGVPSQVLIPLLDNSAGPHFSGRSLGVLDGYYGSISASFSGRCTI